MNNNRKRIHLLGFTLSETIIVLVSLGIISAIVIPQIIHKYQATQSRMKIKKAMSVFDHSFAQFILDNRPRTGNALISIVEGNEANCANFVSYFKAVETDNANACKFKTSDGLWWNVNTITQPIVATSKRAVDDVPANGTDGRNSFKFIASYDKYIGNYRINDINYEKLRLDNDYRTAQNDEDKQIIQNKVDELEKLFGFINPQYAGQYVCKKKLSLQCSSPNYCTKYEYDEKGNKTAEYRGCNNKGNSCSGDTTTWEYDENNNITAKHLCPKANGYSQGPCYYPQKSSYEYGANNKIAKELSTECSGTYCHDYEKEYEYDGQNNIIGIIIKTTTKYGSYTSTSTTKSIYEYDDKTGKLTHVYHGCTLNGDCTKSSSYEYYEYDNQGNLIKERDRIGYIHTYTYENNYLKSEHVKLYNVNSLYYYDENGNIVSSEDLTCNNNGCIRNMAYENTYTEKCM